MNVWCHLPTIINRRRILQFAGILTLCVALITTLFFGAVSSAAPGTNQTISFQGRLLDKNGNPVPDGHFNVQFKIYQDGSGTEAGNPNGTLKWTETHINNGGTGGVLVKNGYLSVDLGSKTPFGTQVDWNQDTLWLSMNIAGSSASCTTFGTSPCRADGEMLPMKRLTATPYALNSSKLEGKSASDFIQNGTTQQTGNFNISGNGFANTLQGNTSVISPLFDSSANGSLSIGSTNATSIQIGSASGNQTINIGTGMGAKQVKVGSLSTGSSLALEGGNLGVSIRTSGEFALHNQTTGLKSFSVADSGNIAVKMGGTNSFAIKDGADYNLLLLDGTGKLEVNGNTYINGEATASKGFFATSADKSQFAGVSYLGNGSTAYFGTTSNTLALQGGGTDLLTAVNSGGQSRVGIGNNATAGYALDVTGDINTSTQLRLGGSVALTNSALNFSGAATSTINAATNQVLQLNSASSVRIGDGVANGQPTLLTLDQSTATPTATGSSVLGSMYYNTTLGRIQCYNATGWGECSTSPDKYVTMNPEYSNAVVNGTGTGTLTNDFCSDMLNINDSATSPNILVCGTNETYNYYSWIGSTTTAQTKSIYVTHKLPANFKKFISGSTTLAGRTNATSATVSVQIYKNTTTGLVSCGTQQTVSTGSQTTWQKYTATSTNDPANCTFTAGQDIVFKINLTATSSSRAFVSTLGYAYSDN